MFKRAIVILICASVAVSFMGCDEDSLSVALPQISADVCRDGGTKNCQIDAGKRELASDYVFQVLLTNPSKRLLKIRSVELKVGEFSPFALLDAPVEIRPGASAPLRLRFRPAAEEEAGAVLRIQSNAGNVQQNESVEIELKGSGLNRGLPDIRVQPNECDWGSVAIGQSRQCELQVQNAGTRALILDSVQFASGEKAFTFLGQPPESGAMISPGQTLSLPLLFSPVAEGKYQHNLELLSNDPDALRIKVPLRGLGVLAPLAKCGIRQASVRPLDNVILTAQGSVAVAEGASLESYRWTIVSQPTGSRATLSAAGGPETGFVFAQGAKGIDLAGRYEVQLEVKDSFGSWSANACVVRFDAIPSESIHIQLTWDTAYGDMDLHLAKRDEKGRYCASNLNSEGRPGPLAERCTQGGYAECNFSTCRATQIAPRPAWGNLGASGLPVGPSLDIDDLSGFGPENINLNQALDGFYLVSVHNFGGGRASGATVRIYLRGQLKAEFYRVLAPSEWWEVALLHWPEERNGHPCIENLATSKLECSDLSTLGQR